MSEVTRCTRCLLPDSLDQLTFDKNGVCDHCRKYEHDFANWDDIAADKKKEFEKILQKAKRMNRPYELSGASFRGQRQYLCPVSGHEGL